MKNPFKKEPRTRSYRRRLAVGAGTMVIAAAVVIVGLSGYHAFSTTAREHRIRQIYTNLNLTEDYQVTASNIFGDKRVYTDDDSRTYSSSQTYQVGKPVDTTVAELRKSIENEGFRFIGEPYPGSLNTEYHFKSDKGEYIRLTVISKLLEDANRNAELLGKDLNPAFPIDTNAAPSDIMIRVNLDDNNE